MASIYCGESDGEAMTRRESIPSPSFAALAAAVPSALLGALVGTLVAGPLGLLVGGVVGAGSGAYTARLALAD